MKKSFLFVFVGLFAGLLLEQSDEFTVSINYAFDPHEIGPWRETRSRGGP